MKALFLTLSLLLSTQVFAAGANYQRITSTFGATGSTTVLISKYLYSFYYSVASNSGATILLEKSLDGSNWSTVQTFTNANGSGVVKNTDVSSQKVRYRFRCSAYTSGSPVVILNEIPYFPNAKLGKRLHVSAGGLAKRLTGSAFSVDNSAASSLVTLAASQTDAKLIVHVPSLPVGSVIRAFNLVGQIESGGNAASLDASLSVGTAVSTDVTEASIADMTRLSVTADAVMGYSNTEKVLSAPRVLNEDENLYVVITATTAASTDIALQGIVIEYDEP